MSRIPFRVAFSNDFINEHGELSFGDIGLELLDKTPLVTYSFLETYHDVVMPEQITDVHGLAIIYPHVTTDTFIRGAEHLTIIARCGVGYDRVDVEACTDNDVALVNAPKAMRLPTAASSLMFMLALGKKLRRLEQIVREGRWNLRGEVRGFELAGRTLGIVGLGNSGCELVRLVAPFEMRVIAYSPHANPEQAHRLNVSLVSLETVLQESDFICLHCRLTEEKRGLIGRRELAMMKSSAYLVNMARGPIVDHDALVTALSEGHIAGAALDVFYEEPLPADDPITDLDNVILTPHWAAGTLDVFYNAGVSNCKAMLCIAEGRLPGNIVNTDVVERPRFQAKLARFKNN